jgi:hypothetical protein
MSIMKRRTRTYLLLKCICILCRCGNFVPNSWFWDMSARVPPMLGEPKAMIHKLTILFWAKCKKPTYITVYKEYIKASMDKYLSVSWTQHLGHAKLDPGSRFMQEHKRISSQYKCKMSNIIVTSLYTFSCYCSC